MVKSIQASGSVDAHIMRLVWKKEEIHQYGFPLYVQEYLNHNATIFKVYCIGKHCHIVTRKSLPNFPKDYRTPIEFDSQEWKFELPPEYTVSYAATHETPDMDHISSIAQEISKYLGLTLFGFDVITDADTHKYAIIDVNYFPGMFKSFENGTVLHSGRPVNVKQVQSPTKFT